MITRTARPATDKQIAFLLRLVAEKAGGQALVQEDMDAKSVKHPRELSVSEVSDVIDRLLDLPRAAAGAGAGTGAAEAEVEPGMYRTADGSIFRVYRGRESQRMLAKRLLREGEGRDGWYFDYAGAASRFVRAADRMSVEEARAWGREYGHCCLCGKVLSDPESLARGTGPICDGRA